ncbi:magnesium transporter [Candidatus Bathyarchaeota archaeon]|nr:magnesium transporter [Candidatus Bathyarchaeota archaeon]
MLRKIIKESMAAEIMSVTGGAFAGLGLAKMIGILETVPSILVMVPGMLALRGDIAGALSSRLGTGLHAGLITPTIKLDKILAKNIFVSLSLSVFESLLVGVIAYYVCLYLNIRPVNLFSLALLGVIAGGTASLVQTPLTVFMAIVVFQKGIDPDSVMGPVVTTIGDVICVICLYGTAKLIFGVG